MWQWCQLAAQSQIVALLTLKMLAGQELLERTVWEGIGIWAALEQQAIAIS